MRLLSLDLATRLGWASGDTEAGDPVSGYYQLPKTGEDIGRFIAAYHNFLVQLIKDQDPELIVFEEPINNAGKTTLSTLLKLWGLCSHTEFVATWKKIHVRQVNSGTWKKGFVGRGGFGKSAKPYPVLVACHERGWEHIVDDNEADAVGLWCFSVRFASPGKEARFDPLARAASFQHVA